MHFKLLFWWIPFLWFPVYTQKSEMILSPQSPNIKWTKVLSQGIKLVVDFDFIIKEGGRVTKQRTTSLSIRYPKDATFSYINYGSKNYPVEIDLQNNTLTIRGFYKRREIRRLLRKRLSLYVSSVDQPPNPEGLQRNPDGSLVNPPKENSVTKVSQLTYVPSEIGIGDMIWVNGSEKLALRFEEILPYLFSTRTAWPPKNHRDLIYEEREAYSIYSIFPGLSPENNLPRNQFWRLANKVEDMNHLERSLAFSTVEYHPRNNEFRLTFQTNPKGNYQQNLFIPGSKQPWIWIRIEGITPNDILASRKYNMTLNGVVFPQGTLQYDGKDHLGNNRLRVELALSFEDLLSWKKKKRNKPVVLKIHAERRPHALRPQDGVFRVEGFRNTLFLDGIIENGLRIANAVWNQIDPTLEFMVLDQDGEPLQRIFLNLSIREDRTIKKPELRLSSGTPFHMDMTEDSGSMAFSLPDLPQLLMESNGLILNLPYLEVETLPGEFAWQVANQFHWLQDGRVNFYLMQWVAEDDQSQLKGPFSQESAIPIPRQDASFFLFAPFHYPRNLKGVPFPKWRIMLAGRRLEAASQAWNQKSQGPEEEPLVINRVFQPEVESYTLELFTANSVQARMTFEIKKNYSSWLFSGFSSETKAEMNPHHILETYGVKLNGPKGWLIIDKVGELARELELHAIGQPFVITWNKPRFGGLDLVLLSGLFLIVGLVIYFVRASKEVQRALQQEQTVEFKVEG